MSYIEAVLQGAIQGFTEFLPISSSGHLSLFQHFTGASSQSSLLFSILLHLATLGAVFIAFRKTVFGLITEFLGIFVDIFTLKILKKPATGKRRTLYMLMLSCVPLFLVLPFKTAVENLSTNSSILEEGVFFILTSAILTFADRCVKGSKNLEEVSVKASLTVGIGQLLAIIPGISRSGTTISAGLLAGISKKSAVEYSFILGMPTILAAALLEVKDFLALSTELNFSLEPMLVGMLVALVTGLLAIKLVAYIVKTDKFKIFAIYTFILGILVICVGAYELVTGRTIVI